MSFCTSNFTFPTPWFVANDGDLHRNLLKTWMLRRHDRLPRSKESASDAVLESTEIGKKPRIDVRFARRSSPGGIERRQRAGEG
jgi:hypothetical protein